jgi:hypothetical protein
MNPQQAFGQPTGELAEINNPGDRNSLPEDFVGNTNLKGNRAKNLIHDLQIQSQ